MKTYLVGGAVRDHLLGLPVTEQDWVVVGSNAQQMLALGYQQVGKGFPVFLHPESGEEYALARTERKQGQGHTGFVMQAHESVTLKQDLQRRDLTINAIAQDKNGNLIDPCGGVSDINQRRLAHISNAFTEDPLRVFRVARFAAKLQHLGFSITPPTLKLMQEISGSGEIQLLPAERIWREIDKALGEPSPQIFLQTLYRCNALEIILPALSQRFHQSDNLRDTASNIGERILTALAYAATQQYSKRVRWAIIFHAYEAATTPQNLVARIIKPPARNNATQTACNALKAPNDFTRLAVLAAHTMAFIVQAKNSKPDLIIDLLDTCDAWRRPEQFNELLQVAESVIATDSEKPLKNLASTTLLRQVYQACKQVNAAEFIEAGLQGEELGKAIHQARKLRTAAVLAQFKPH
jgi:tRNA nucleotidyltransferase (CCA-adding enzyme)